MSYSTIYADSLTAYQNGQNMANAIQKKIENVADNEVLFGNVDYSSSYDSILDNFSSSAAGDSSGDGSGDSSTEGSSQSGELAADGGTKATEEQIEQLRAAYQQVQDQQGWVGKAWNGIKNFFGHSNGSNAVEDTINKAAAGEISYEAAVEKLNTYASKQGSVVDVFANIASGLAVAAGVILAPVSFGASLAIGAGVGAAVKVGVKASNAATNNVEGDYSLKDGLKDGVTYLWENGTTEDSASFSNDTDKLLIAGKTPYTLQEALNKGIINQTDYDGYVNAINNAGISYGSGVYGPDDFYLYVDDNNRIHFALISDVNDNSGAAVTYDYIANGAYTKNTEYDYTQLEFDVSTGRITSITIPTTYDAEGKPLTYTTIDVSAETVTDEAAYQDAYAQYEYEQYLYDKKQQEINAKTEIIQQEDRNLELKLQRLDNERTQITTEIEAVEKVINDNIESSYKTFSG